MTVKFRLFATAASGFVLMALSAEQGPDLQFATPARAQASKAVVKLPACPEKGIIFNNTCYVDTGSKAEMGRDPTAAPVCYPGYYVRLPYPPFHYCIRQYKKNDDKSPH